MKIENLEFWDSVELLAERAHINLEKYEVREIIPQEMKKSKGSAEKYTVLLHFNESM